MALPHAPAAIADALARSAAQRALACLSSEASASLLSAFHAPAEMRLTCLPITGTCAFSKIITIHLFLSGRGVVGGPGSGALAVRSLVGWARLRRAPRRPSGLARGVAAPRLLERALVVDEQVALQRAHRQLRAAAGEGTEGAERGEGRAGAGLLLVALAEGEGGKLFDSHATRAPGILGGRGERPPLAGLGPPARAPAGR